MVCVEGKEEKGEEKMRNDKRGLTTFGLILVVIVALILMIFIVMLSFAMGTADQVLSQLNGTIGNTSIAETYQDTLKGGIVAMETTVPQIVSTGVLLGMILAMLIVGFNVKKIHQIWMAVDIVIIIIAEALASLVTTNFIVYISSNEAFTAIARDTLPQAAKFILNLPILVPTIGVVVMLITYFTTKEKEEETGF
ncbi:hypothetical protein LCGC14_0924730 [marine sediment metagenome]|uniref:Uncharacterized protein n=1 Tax=marine sediment metagenome TaxID=412755 RepID=A0A0F9RWE2_9ZZZZ